MWVIILIKRIFTFVLVLALLIPTNAFASTTQICASKAVAMDMATKTVFYGKEMNTKAPMASTTKIMTCLLACEYGNLKKMVTINSKMLDGTEGSLIYLSVGDKISMLDLIKGAMLASGNDAANAIAFVIGGDIEGFSKLMNERSKAFGMNNTHFVTPSGLDDKNHYSTAYDMAILTAKALKNSVFSSICSKNSDTITISGKKQTIYNHNKLLNSSSSCIGVKTGFTSRSGRCLVSAFNYNENVIIIVTLNDGDDWNDHKKLFEFSKEKYSNLTKGYMLNIPCVGGSLKQVKCCAKVDAAYIGKISFKEYYYPFIYAPVLKGTRVGRLEIYSNNNLLKTVDITVLESVTVWQTTK